MLELIHTGTPNIVCTQPFACLPNHVVGKGVIKELRHRYPDSNIVAIDYDPGASEVNQLNRIKLMLSTANKNLKKDTELIRKNSKFNLFYAIIINSFISYWLRVHCEQTCVRMSIGENE